MASEDHLWNSHTHTLWCFFFWMVACGDDGAVYVCGFIYYWMMDPPTRCVMLSEC